MIISSTNIFRELRKQFSVAEMSEKSGVSKSTIRRILDGHEGDTKFGNVIAVAQSCGKTIRIIDDDSYDQDAFY